MHQRTGLFSDCLDYRRVAVAEGTDSYAGQKIKIFFTPGVPDARSRPLYGGQGQTAVCFHDIFVAEFDNLFVSQKKHSLLLLYNHGSNSPVCKYFQED